MSAGVVSGESSLPGSQPAAFPLYSPVALEPSSSLVGALLSVMLQSEWEGSLGENGYVYTFGWVALLCT